LPRRAACLLLCSAVLCSPAVTGCGGEIQRPGQSAETSTGPTISTENKACEPRGTGLVSVSARPGKKTLSNASVNVIELRQNWAFAVTVFNGGCLSEKHIAVRLSILSGEQPMTSAGQIDQIDPGEKRTVVVGHFGLPDLQKRLLIRVEVEPVPTEMKLENNSAEYPVRFVLVGP
jgi:hypothetical protein